MNNSQITTEIEAVPVTSSKHNIFYRATHSKYSYLVFCFLLPAMLMRLIYVCVGVFPELDGSVLVLDLNGQYVYFYEALRSFIHGDASLLYSFSRALGGEFLGIYAYYVASPLAWIVALFPKSMILDALLVIFIIKTGLCGLTFGFYLHKTSARINRMTIVTISTMYALCSYAIVQSHNSMWIDALIWLPIITYAIEQLIKKGSYKLFVISLSIMLISHYYIGYMICIYVALYFFYYYCAHKGANERGERAHFLRSLIRIGFFSLIALGIAAVILLGAFYSLQFGKSTFSDPNFEFKTRYNLIDLFAKFFPGTYDTVRPSGLPIVFCGTLSLLSLPFYYFSKRITLREKIFSSLFVAVFVLSFTINTLDLVWHGFQVPNWLNYRYSFMLTFIMLTMVYKGICQVRRQSSKAVFFTGSFLIFAIILLQSMEFKNFVINNEGFYTAGKLDTFRTVWFTIIAVIAYCAVLYAIIRAKKLKEIKKASKLLLIVVCAEMLLNGVVNITALHFDVTYSSKSSYNDFFEKLQPIVAEIQEQDDSFYRMEKTHHRKTNDNMTLGIRGLSGSTSTLNKETIKFLNNMGYSSKSHWSKYLGGNPANDSLLGIKYVVAQKDQPKNYASYNENQAINALMNELYTVVAEDEHYIAYQNPYSLSIAFAVSNQVTDFKFSKELDDVTSKALYLSPFERINKVFSSMLGEDIQIFVPIDTDNITYSGAKKSSIAGHSKYAPLSGAAKAAVTLTAEIPTTAHVFFYATSEYPREVKLAVGENNFGDFMANESNRIKAIGKFNEGETVNVTLTLSSDTLYLKQNDAYMYYLDISAFISATEKLSSEQFTIDEFTEKSFDGRITTTDEASVIQTTIPYDEGWKIYVDGKQAEIFKTFDALIAFNIDGTGEHHIEIKYSPKIISVGLIISISSIGIFVVICGIDSTVKLIKRKKDEKKTLSETATEK